MATGKQPAESAPATAALDQPGSGAEISDCQRYRYALWRRWADGPAVLFVMLNPSTADARSDDPTIRRCIGFARSWDYAAVLVANLFALRTPHPSRLLRARSPIGPDNDAWLRRLQSAAGLTVAAWGNHGRHRRRSEKIRPLLAQVSVLGLTQLGEPRHPLYVRADTRPQAWLA